MLASFKSKLASDTESGAHGHIGECCEWHILSVWFSLVFCFSGGVLSKSSKDHCLLLADPPLVPAGTSRNPYKIN